MSEIRVDETAVVTGGASGIGRSIALQLASHGADVVVADLREEPQTPDTTPTMEDRTDARSSFAGCDVTNYDDVVGAVDAAEEFGGVDATVNNAGVVHPVDFFDTRTGTSTRWST